MSPWYVALLVLAGTMLWPGRPAAEGRHSRDGRTGTTPGEADPDGPDDHGGGDPADGSPLTASALAEAAELLAVALGGGAALLTALDVVADVVGGRAGHELRVVAAAARWGLPLDEAWALASPAWQPVASAFVVAERAGVAPASLLAETSGALRREASQQAAVRAGALSARLALPLGLTFLPGFVLTTIVPVVLGLARVVVSD